MGLYDVLRKKRNPLDIEGFAGGTLREQLGRGPGWKPGGLDPKTGAIWEAPRQPEEPDDQPRPRIAFGSNGLSGLDKPDTPSEPMAGGVRLPSIIPTTTPSQTNPYEGYTPTKAPPQPINVRVGANTAGMTPLDRAITVLDTRRQAAQDYPSSKVTSSGEVLPPKTHHGFWDRLKSLGEGALMGMGNADPRLGGAGGIGAAIGGAIRGGVSPTSIDQAKANAKVERDTQSLGQQLKLEDVRAQVEQRRQEPQLRRDALEAQKKTLEDKNAEQERDNLITIYKDILASGGLSPDNPEHVALHDRAKELKMNLPYGKKSAADRVFKQADEQGNIYYADPETGEALKDRNGNIRYAERAKGEKKGLSPEVIDRNIGAIRTQQEKIDEFLNSPTNHYITVPNGEPYQDKDGKVITPTTTKVNPEWEQAKQDRNRLDAEIREWEAKRKGPPASTSTAPSPSTHVLNKTEWLKHHPASDWPKAVAAAKAAGYQIIQ